MADVTTVAELLVVMVILIAVFLIVYRLIVGYEMSRKSGAEKSSSNFKEMIDHYQLRKGIDIQFSLINQTLPGEVKFSDHVKIYTAPIEKEFAQSSKIRLDVGSAELVVNGVSYPFECTKEHLGSNVDMFVCGVKDIRFKDAFIISTITGIISDGKFTGSVTVTLKS